MRLSPFAGMKSNRNRRRRTFLPVGSAAGILFTLLPALLLSILDSSSCHGQWVATYGDFNWEEAYSIEETRDGGYVVGGYTLSFSLGWSDMWVLKLDPDGTVEWQKTFGRTDEEEARSVQQTDDGGYIVAGYTYSFDADGPDFWVLKLDPAGIVEWQKRYEGDDYGFPHEFPWCIRQTADGGYIVAGYTASFGAVNDDVWVLKIDSLGVIEWQGAYGGRGEDWAKSIEQTADGGYIVAGYSYYFGPGESDSFVLKLGPGGKLEWSNAYGGKGDDYAKSIEQTTDGGYIVAGHTTSYGAGDADVWVLKLRPNGRPEWQKTYGRNSREEAESIQQTTDGGYVVAGRSADKLLALKLSAGGQIEWQKVCGGDWEDRANAIRQTRDGGYVVAGRTQSFGEGVADVWVLRLQADGTVDPSCTLISDADLLVMDSGLPWARTLRENVRKMTGTSADTAVWGLDSEATVNVQCTGESRDGPLPPTRRDRAAWESISP